MLKNQGNFAEQVVCSKKQREEHDRRERKEFKRDKLEKKGAARKLRKAYRSEAQFLYLSFESGLAAAAKQDTTAA